MSKRVSKELDARVRQFGDNRCNYCLAPQKLISYKLEVEHILPTAKGGTGDEQNLCLACRECNLHKAAKTHGFDFVTAKRVKLFNPRRQKWRRHFLFGADETLIIGKTACGRATIAALHINNELQVTARGFWRLTDLFPPRDF